MFTNSKIYEVSHFTSIIYYKIQIYIPDKKVFAAKMTQEKY